jgi:hypothetical protein
MDKGIKVGDRTFARTREGISASISYGEGLKDGYAEAALALGYSPFRAALEKIVRWEEAERPHKNIPLLDCADLARRALEEDTCV